MTDDEIEQKFAEALERWHSIESNPKIVDVEAVRAVRFFFWDGASMGLEAGHAIYTDSYK